MGLITYARGRGGERIDSNAVVVSTVIDIAESNEEYEREVGENEAVRRHEPHGFHAIYDLLLAVPMIP